MRGGPHKVKVKVSKSNNRFMDGPEPSWLRKKKEEKDGSWNGIGIEKKLG